MFEVDDPTTIDYTVRPHDALTKAIIGAGIEVHKALGPGLLEATLKISGHQVGLLMNFNVRKLKEGVRRIIV